MDALSRFGDGASDSTSKDVDVPGTDSDGDGLTDCEENAGGTDACGDAWSSPARGARPAAGDKISGNGGGRVQGPAPYLRCGHRWTVKTGWTRLTETPS